MPRLKGKKYNTDFKELRRLLQEARGEDRTYAQFAADAGVGAATISKILHGSDASSKVLFALTSEQASPRGKVTVDMLLKAAGYDPEETKKEHERLIQSGTGLGKTNPFGLLNTEKMMEMIVSNALIKKGIQLHGVSAKDLHVGDFTIILQGTPITKWIFEFKLFSGKTSEQMIRDWLFRQVMNKPEKETKASLVVCDTETFDRLAWFKDNLSYRGELSVIQVSLSELSVKKEIYLSHYEQDDDSRSIYLG